MHSLAGRAGAAGPGREQDFTQLDSAQGQLGLGFIEQQVARFHYAKPSFIHPCLPAAAAGARLHILQCVALGSN